MPSYMYSDVILFSSPALPSLPGANANLSGFVLRVGKPSMQPLAGVPRTLALSGCAAASSRRQLAACQLIIEVPASTAIE